MSEQNKGDILQFTRQDVERLKAIELNTGQTAKGIFELGKKLESFTCAHLQLHEVLISKIDDAQRFTKTTRGIIRWTMRVLAGGGFLWIVDNVARAAGLVK